MCTPGGGAATAKGFGTIGDGPPEMTLWGVDCLFLLAMLGALQAKKGNQPAKVSNLSLTVLRVRVPDGPNFFCSGCGAP